MGDGIVVTFAGGKRVDARFGDFLVRTDQSVKDGGRGEEPSPFDYFLASLATCAGIYVLGFCQARDLPTDGIRVVQRQRSHPKTRALEEVEIVIEVPPDFPPRYHDALVRVAGKCAVKRALANPPEFQLRTVVRGD